jgi:LDH2 family malate/lactate/ureidoglycolate dehydrogenase
MLALPHDMIGVALSASEPLMVPTFGRDPRLGTNPIAVAAPCAEEPPFVYDAATTAVAGNKIYAAWLRGAVVPGGLLADADGAPMLAPQPAPGPARYQGLLPLGSTPELGSHKGYGLACVVEVLSHVLGGLTFGLRAGAGHHGHFLAAVDVGAFSPADAFKGAMDDFVRALKATPPAAGQERVLAPGQLEWETQRERSVRGVPLRREVVAWFDTVSAELGLTDRLPRLA